MVSGLLNTSFQVGSAIFLAVVTAVVTSGAGGHAAGKQAVLDSYRPGLWVVAGIGFAGLLITLTGVRRRRPSYGVLVASSAAEDARRDTGTAADPSAVPAAERSGQVAVRD